MSIVLNKEQIKSFIPHREPFLLIDYVSEISIDECYIICGKSVLKDDWFFAGHFPGYPIMPGVLIIEALAQASAIYAVHIIGDAAKKKPVFFTSIDCAKFRNPVYPEQNLKLYAKLTRKSSILWKFSCNASVNEKTVAEANITATINLGK